MNPLPDIDIAYSMVLQCEKQRRTQQNYTDLYDNSALMTKDQNMRSIETGENSAMMTRDTRKYGNSFEKNQQRKQDKMNLYCDYCKAKGHSRDTFFKLNGYPEWYKKIQENKGKSRPKGLPL